MNFRSDNESPVAPEILQAICAANQGAANAYGADPQSAQLESVFSELFECPLTVLPIVSGTAANAIALAQICPPYGAVFCHQEAHINVDECGAPEFYGGGLKLVALPGKHGKVAVADVLDGIEKLGYHGDHDPVPAALSLTQATEMGTLYSLAELRSLSEAAHAHGMAVHMDGARVANAVCALDCTPADITWRNGVDILSFGATKNGALGAEALVVFNDRYRENIARRGMKGGHLLSKMRYVSAQLLAYLEQGLWLRLASHANQCATTLAEQLLQWPDAKLAAPVQCNEVFIDLPAAAAEAIRTRGARFHPWPGIPGRYRFVTAWDTPREKLLHLAPV